MSVRFTWNPLLALHTYPEPNSLRWVHMDFAVETADMSATCDAGDHDDDDDDDEHDEHDNGDDDGDDDDDGGMITC